MSAFAATTVYAQDTTESAQVEEVVVTGSRIVRQDYVSSSPIVTTNREALERTGGVTVELLLNQLPQFVPSISQSSNNPSNGGQANIDLRGVGSARTLVLMDGRRITPSNSNGVVDLNTIPSALIESIETITGGASSTYGSDAVAGVVNFKLKRRFQGIEANVQWGQTERGDGETGDVSLTVGGNFDEDKGNAVLSFGYSNRLDVFNGDREFSAISGASAALPQGAYQPLGNNLPTQAAVNAVFAKYGVAPGVVTNNNSHLYFNDDGTLFNGPNNYKGPTTIDYSTIVQGAGSVGTGLYNTGALNYLLLPLTRYNAFGRAEYEVNPHFTAYGQFMYTSYKGVQQLAPSPASGNPGVGSTGFLVPVTNPFVPTDLRAILATRPNPTAPFLFNKRLSFSGGRVSTNEYDVAQYLIGARGDLGADWTYDAFLSRGRQTRMETQSGNVSHSAVRTLLEAADGGASLCSGGLNLFGNQPISAACSTYVTRITKNYTTYDQDIAEIDIQGPLFDLPAGKVRAAIGADYMRNAFNFVPDGLTSGRDVSGTGTPLANNTAEVIGFNAQNPLRGSTDVYELYGELLVPVLKDLPFVEDLNLTLGGRYSDHNTVGGVSTYRVNGDWEIVPSVRIRGGYSRAVRAPSVGELYAPSNQNFPSIGAASATTAAGDPCDIRSIYRKGANAAQVRALCLAQGVPAAIIDSYQYGSQQVQSQTSGNPNLTEETADTYSVGLVWQSRFEHPLLRRMSVSIDYYNMKIEDIINPPPTNTALQYCFNNPLGGPTNPTFSNTFSLCQLFRRDPATGNIVSFNATNQNIALNKTAGVDFQLDWSAGLDAFGLDSRYGTVNINVVGNYLDKFTVNNIPLPGAAATDYRGTIGSATASAFPKWKVNSNLGYAVGPASLVLTWRYIDKMKNFSAGEGVPTINYFDLAARWRLNDTIELRGGVNNLADKDPPTYTPAVQANTDPSTYDVLGRRYYVGLKLRY